jgi:hypothetical protein
VIHGSACYDGANLVAALELESGPRAANCTTRTDVTPSHLIALGTRGETRAAPLFRGDEVARPYGLVRGRRWRAVRSKRCGSTGASGRAESVKPRVRIRALFEVLRNGRLVSGDPERIRTRQATTCHRNLAASLKEGSPAHGTREESRPVGPQSWEVPPNGT